MQDTVIKNIGQYTCTSCRSQDMSLHTSPCTVQEETKIVTSGLYMALALSLAGVSCELWLAYIYLDNGLDIYPD